MTMNRVELQARYDSRKSFYKKAYVDSFDNGLLRLVSYGTDVAKIVDGKATVFGYFSATTQRHVREFLRQHGFKADNWKQTKSDYYQE